MSFEEIERLKAAMTDRYVAVRSGAAEFARFGHAVGRVKTVNMSGRALVQFEDYLNNPAWHDIDLAALEVVDAPAQAPESSPPAPVKRAAKPPTKGASAASAADVLAAARAAAKPAGPQAPPAPRPTSPSVGKATDAILQAARAGASAGATPAKRVSPAAGLATAAVLAAARGRASSGPAAQPDSDPSPASPPKRPPATPSGMTTEEILAAARAAKKAPANTEAPATPSESDGGGSATPQRTRMSAADIRDLGAGKLSIRREQPVAVEPKAKPAALPAAGDARPAALPAKIDRTKLTAADILALGAGVRQPPAQ